MVRSFDDFWMGLPAHLGFLFLDSERLELLHNVDLENNLAIPVDPPPPVHRRQNRKYIKLARPDISLGE